MAPFVCVSRKYEEKNVQEEVDLYHFVKLLLGGGKGKRMVSTVVHAFISTPLDK